MAPLATSKPSSLEDRVLADLPPHWLHGDDRCDCPIQRIGEWTNPYIGKTVQIRLCCVWAKLAELFPTFCQTVDAFYDDNTDQWVKGTQPWDSEDADMPLYLWYRQLAEQHGVTLDEARRLSKTTPRPGRVPKGTGRESKRVSPEQIARARQSRLNQTGWV